MFDATKETIWSEIRCERDVMMARFMDRFEEAKARCQAIAKSRNVTITSSRLRDPVTDADGSIVFYLDCRCEPAKETVTA